jgi:hypothetical protein
MGEADDFEALITAGVSSLGTFAGVRIREIANGPSPGAWRWAFPLVVFSLQLFLHFFAIRLASEAAEG